MILKEDSASCSGKYFMKTLSVIMLVGIVTVLFMLPSISDARMNETDSEMKARYGASVMEDPAHPFPLLEGAVSRIYSFNGWTIRAAFLHERVVRISYKKIAVPKISQLIQGDEAQAILDAEVGNGKWEELGPLQPKPLNSLPWAASNKAWVHSNGNVACLILNRLILQIDSPAVDTYQAGRAAEKEAKRKASIPKF